MNQRKRKLLRTELLKRQKNCPICLFPLKTNVRSNYFNIEIDHKKPVSKGGSNKLVNLRLTHRICNRIRGIKDTSFKLKHLWSKAK
jgi:5-methylcytosine-specific restriction endonuclease McrA